MALSPGTFLKPSEEGGVKEQTVCLPFCRWQIWFQWKPGSRCWKIHPAGQSRLRISPTCTEGRTSDQRRSIHCVSQHSVPVNTLCVSGWVWQVTPHQKQLRAKGYPYQNLQLLKECRAYPHILIVQFRTHLPINRLPDAHTGWRRSHLSPNIFAPTYSGFILPSYLGTWNCWRCERNWSELDTMLEGVGEAEDKLGQVLSKSIVTLLLNYWYIALLPRQAFFIWARFYQKKTAEQGPRASGPLLLR